MLEQIQQIKIILANVNAYIQALLNENNILRKQNEDLKKQLEQK